MGFIAFTEKGRILMNRRETFFFWWNVAVGYKLNF